MEAPSGINVTALALYNDKIYAGTDKGLVYEIDGRGEVRRLPLGVHDEINVFLVYRGRLLIGTEGYGLVSFDGATDRAERIDPNYTAPYVRSLAVDSQRRLWVGTFTGLYIMDAERKKIVFKDNASSPEGGLSHSSVRRIYIDDNGDICLGTFFGGLNYYPTKCRASTIFSMRRRANCGSPRSTEYGSLKNPTTAPEKSPAAPPTSFATAKDGYGSEVRTVWQYTPRKATA